MRFIKIQTPHGDEVAVNTQMITSLQMGHDTVYIYLSGDHPIQTRFTDIEHAIDYIQRAQSVTLTQGV
jgi:hypothetical protein